MGVMDQSKDHEKLCCSKKKKLEKRKGKGEKYPLSSFSELPDYMKDNEFILNYYRVHWPIKEAFFSLFRWHNETLNVWTHLVGFLVFVGFTVAHLVDAPQMADLITIFVGQFPSSSQSNISKFSLGHLESQSSHQEQTIRMDVNALPMINRWPFYIFLSGSMFCLLTSSMCHLFGCHSQKLSLHLLRFDYIGIAVMIITSFFPPIYYIFQCTPHWQLTYLSVITILGIFTIITLLSPALSRGEYRRFRALLFVFMGLFGVIPAIHALILNWNDPHRNITLAYESAMALSYLIGAAFFVIRVPERWWPGRFDLVGQSHQIFHVLVVIGALAHYGAAQVFLRYRSGMFCET